MYNYPNIRKLKTSYCSNSNSKNELEYHIFINDRKWRDMMNNEDLRFFKHNKMLLNNVFQNDNGHVLRIGSWDSLKLANDYTRSKKYKHINLTDYECYFEYEMDIIHYLCNDNEYPMDDMNEVAVIIKPYFISINDFHCNDLEMIALLKQILLTVFLMFFKYRIGFQNICFDNIGVKKYNKKHNIVYDIGHKSYSVKSKNIIKIDEYRNIKKYNSLNHEEYKELNKNVKKVLEQFNKIYQIYNIFDIKNNEKEITNKESSVNMLNDLFECFDKYF